MIMVLGENTSIPPEDGIDQMPETSHARASGEISSIYHMLLMCQALRLISYGS